MSAHTDVRPRNSERAPEVAPGVTPGVTPEAGTPAPVPVPRDAVLAVEDVPESEFDQYTLVKAGRARSEIQTLIDTQVRALHSKWAVGGRLPVVQAPRARRVVAPEHATEIRRMLVSAAKYLEVSIHFFEAARTEDGKTVLAYTVRDRNPSLGRPKGSKNTTPAADADTAPDASAADSE